MSWDEHSRRRAAIRSVLAYAETYPAHGLPYDHVPAARQAFRSRRELVLALQYAWTQALWAQIELLSLDSHGRALTDAGALARTAWSDCAARHPVLRRLLDRHRDELGPPARPEEQDRTQELPYPTSRVA